jgi:iron(III) transport system ATP-binding protein
VSHDTPTEQHGTRLVIKDIRKTYTETVALDNVSLEVEPGEFFTLLGPSGCGKTTLLRSVAGFVVPNHGEIYFNNDRIDTLPPQKRNIGMVFQDYAVFPHMSVLKNVGYGLVSRRIQGQEAEDRITAALRLVDMENLAHRMPSQLSGGQQQRVAVARAVVVRPSVLLMDEPLSNLDAKLRIQMRRDIRELQSNLKITTVYVTHDQAEALAVSDRIAVMRNGMVEQIAPPEELYRKPKTEFVARFLGNENIVSADVVSVEGSTITVDHKGVTYRVPNPDNLLGVGDAVSFLLRSEILEFAAASGVAAGASAAATETPAGNASATRVPIGTAPDQFCFIRGQVIRCEYGGALLRTLVRVSEDVLFEVLSVHDALGRRPEQGENVTLRYRVPDATVFPLRVGGAVS